MDYLDINFRLQEIIREIHDLRSTEAGSIRAKIDALHTINRLLKEQNRLLSIKQEIIEVVKFPLHNIRIAG